MLYRRPDEMINWKKRQGHSLHSVARLVVAAGRVGAVGGEELSEALSF
jgi:hypothetical protein